jgi:hypothetical protein
VGLLFVAVSCSDKGKNPTIRNPQTPSEETPPTQDTNVPAESSTAPGVSLPVVTEPVVTPPLQNQVTEKNVDVHTSTYISELKEQLSHDPLSHEKRIRNVEFANRVFEVDFKFSQKSPHLSLVTHSAKAFQFEFVSHNANVFYFNAYENRKDILDKSVRATVFSAEATILSQQPKKTVAIIRIKDIETTAIINIFYVKKAGSLVPVYLPGNDYVNDLTKTSKVFLQRLIEDSDVEGSFYSVITEERNISTASKFRLSVSNNFTLESAALLGNYREDQPNLVPLKIDYKSFWKIFFFGSTAYKVIKEASYIIESPRNPVELSALNLQLKIEGKEKIKGQKNTLPLQLHINL